MRSKVTNVVIAGLGGQGVLKASDILADVAMSTGLDVKKSEIKGMSQRGGSVTSDVRFGAEVFSPMVPEGEADFLVVLETTQVPVTRSLLKADGVLIEPGQFDASRLQSKKSLNVALLGILSRYLDIPEDAWHKAVAANLGEKLYQMNLQAFTAGRNG